MVDKFKHIFIYWDFQQNQCLNIKKACVHKIHRIASWGPCAHGAPGHLPSVPMRSDGTESDASTFCFNLYFCVNNAVNRSVNESSILIGRISKQESNKKNNCCLLGIYSSTFSNIRLIYIYSEGLWTFIPTTNWFFLYIKGHVLISLFFGLAP